jgi:hypothetical protein
MRITQALFLALAALFIVAPPTSARAADIAFFPAETSNLSPSDALAVGELLAQSYASVSHQAVLSPTRTQDTVAKSPSYEAAAATLGVAEYVRISTLAVGRLIVVTATRYQADGTSLYQSKMTAQAVEDIPAISDRMAKSLFYRVDDEEVRTRHNVTMTEARVENRRATEKVIGIKTGLYVPFAKDADYAPHVSVQFDMRFEMDRFFLEFGAGIILPTKLDDDDYCYDPETGADCTSNDRDGHLAAFTAELGGSYFLTDGNIAPYIGVGLIPRLLLSGNNDLASMAGYGQVGLMLPRDSSTRFYVDARVAQTFIEAELDNGRGVLPTELTLHLGVGW